MVLAVLASAFIGFRLYAQPEIPWDTLPSATCTPPDEAGSGRVFHVDPVRGTSDGDGSAERPWNDLQPLVTSGRLSAQERALWRSERIMAGIAHRLPIVGARERPQAVVGDGDTILLATGDYGDVDIARLVNRRFVTIAAAPGAEVTFSSLRMAGASHFLLRGITITAPSRREDSRYLVDTVGLHIAVRADNIVFDDVSFAGGTSIADTSPADFAAIAPSGLRLSGDCISVTGSRFSNLHTAATLYRARDARFESNTIRDFSVDGVQFSGQRIAIRRNLVVDNWPTGDALHPDCMQGQPPDDIEFGPVMIEGNVCIARTSGELLPNSGWQGIAIFDGRWRDVTVRCNLVAPNSRHGIALYGVDGQLVEHNMVVGTRGGRFAWIAIMPSKEGRMPTAATVRANAAAGYLNAVGGGPLPVPAMIAAFKVNPADRILHERLSAQISGVVLADNEWLIEEGSAAPMADPRFVYRQVPRADFPLALNEARTAFPLPPECAGLGPAGSPEDQG